MAIKKIIALTITLMMVISCLPVNAISKIALAENDLSTQAELAAFWKAFDRKESSYLNQKLDKESVVDLAYDAVLSSKYVDADTALRIDSDTFSFELANGIPCVYDYNTRNTEHVPTVNADVVEQLAQKGTSTDKDILVIGPYYGIDNNFSDQYENEATSLASYTGGTATVLQAAAATGPAVAEAINDYGVVFLDSHGVSAYSSSYFCLTTVSGITNADYMNYSVVSTGSGTCAIDGKYINNHKDGTLPDSLIWMAICEGMMTTGLCNPLREMGAAVVYGYSQSVTFSGDYLYEARFWGEMKTGKTVAQAIASMKLTYGNYDYYGNAYPVVVSDTDAYPANPDSPQTVTSDWTLIRGAEFTLDSVLNVTGGTLNFTTDADAPFVVDNETHSGRTTAHTNVKDGKIQLRIQLNQGDAVMYSIFVSPYAEGDVALVKGGNTVLQSTAVNNWSTYILSILETGTYVFTWQYDKHSTGSSENEGVWLDNISVLPAYRRIIRFIDGVTNTMIRQYGVEPGTVLSTEHFPAAPVHEGYTFSSWSVSAGTIINDHTEIIAQYDKKSYTVTFIDGYDNSLISTTSVLYGDDAVMPSPPAHEGYAFTGWDKTGKAISEDTTITALYESMDYSVTFVDGHTGETIKNMVIPYGTPLIPSDYPTAPEHYGYTFTGWDREIVPTYYLTEDITITALYSVTEYTVTFIDGFNNSVITTQLVSHGDCVFFPTAPTHTGYGFMGWDHNGQNITADTTITAIYEKDFISVTLMDGLTGSYIDTINVLYGGNVVFPNPPVHTGYDFAGWSHSGENITENMTITAQYSKKVFTVSYVDGISGETISTEQVAYGENAVSFPTAPTHEGYSFAEWDHLGENITDNTTITALYDRIELTVSLFDSVTESYFDVLTVYYGDDAVLPTPPVHEGYTFTGWDNNGKNITEDTTITALYAKKEYTVTFVDGVTNTTISSVTVEHGDNVTFPTVPTHEGYTFTGWDNSGKNITQDTAITALYSKNTLTVTFVDGVTSTTISTIGVEYGEDVIFPTAPTHEGYTFTGWDNNGKNITQDTAITALYSKDTFTVTFVDDLTNTTISTIVVEYGEDVIFPTAPEHEGYTFAGWDNSGENLTHDTIITALYAKAEFTVTFIDGVTGTVIFTFNVEYGNSVFFPNAPEHEGYIFTGWDNNGASITQNTTITALYEKIEYTVTFIDGVTGNVFTTTEVEYGDNVVFPNPPTHEGYSFTGWNSSGENITQNVTITALYNKLACTVTFIDEVTGDVITTAEVEYGNNVAFPNAPTHEGYTFIGWDNSGENITDDITITAQYAMIEFTITFIDGATGNVITTTVLEYGDDIVFPNAPTHEGYTFTGWDNSGENITQDTTITALYSINKYTVTFIDEVTGEVITTVIIEHGNNVAFPNAPAHEGYTFTGWDNSGENITQDTTITAQYNNSSVLGDANGDGSVSMVDALIILRFLSGWDITVDVATCDIDGDGRVGMIDALLILRYLAGWDVIYFGF